MNKGFTLIELLVVVLIIGVLSAVALPQYTTAVEKSRAAEALTLSSAARGAAERYFFQKGIWPDSFNKLDVQIPQGKSFEMSLGNTSVAGYSFAINAKRKGQGYYIVTLLGEDGELVTSKRCCSSTQNTCTPPTAEKPLKICNAITGGSNNNF